LTLFPYCLEALPGVLAAEWDSAEFAPYRDAFPEEHRATPAMLETHVRDLVARDVKIAYLKSLQGYLWEDGYSSGSIKAPLFGDVAPAISAWRDHGIQVMIYSSGSVPAQKLFFGHTDATPSDLCPAISDWFDTVNAGPKTEPASYSTIVAAHPDVAPSQWLFLSDNPLEVRAAHAAGLQSLAVSRPGNASIPSEHQDLADTMVSNFDGLHDLI
jgi:enolase-phosphatase E1